MRDLKNLTCLLLLFAVLTLNGEVNHTVKKVLNYEKLHTVIHRQQQKKKIVFTTKVSHYNKLYTFFFYYFLFRSMFFSFTSFRSVRYENTTINIEVFFIVFMLSVKHVACNIQQQHFCSV